MAITNSQNLPKLMTVESVVPSNYLILCRPLLLPSIFPSIRVFSNDSVICIRWPKYWSFSFSISLSNEYSGLIFFMKDWSDLLVVQGTLKSLLQHHSPKASALCHSAFFMIQFSHPYMTTGKIIALIFLLTILIPVCASSKLASCAINPCYCVFHFGYSILHLSLAALYIFKLFKT